MADCLPLFVFGTLRRGQRNHHLLAGRYTRMRPARLPGFVKRHPLMIQAQPDGVVRGELYHLRPGMYDATMRDCDELEGIAPGQTVGCDYRRLRVMVETPEGRIEAWAYVHPETAAVPT
ncbi:MAG TPA: gamma-glutamylcyclotransferase family protein [Planctomycetaceae bacterium]|nr:gamma-glutamylcyclotransferase family protein [Planctomycetaceae bacterium]